MAQIEDDNIKESLDVKLFIVVNPSLCNGYVNTNDLMKVSR